MASLVGDLGSIPGLGRSPGEGKGYPLQYAGLENSMDCVVHGVAKSWTRMKDFHSSGVLKYKIKVSAKLLPSVMTMRKGFVRGLSAQLVDGYHLPVSLHHLPSVCVSTFSPLVRTLIILSGSLLS